MLGGVVRSVPQRESMVGLGVRAAARDATTVSIIVLLSSNAYAAPQYKVCGRGV